MPTKLFRECQIKREVKEVINVMNQAHGREISMYDDSFLQKSLKKRCISIGAKTHSDYLQHLEKNSSEAEAFNDSLNINYSEFFRNPLTFALLDQWILPKLIKQKAGRGEIRVWSAGCSAGQEAYSIAMLLDKFNINAEESIRFRIFATDISLSMLEFARKGIYEKDALQNLKLKQLSNYFTQKGETSTIASKLRDSITFSTYDLLDKLSVNPEESIYGDFDIVLCSNLLFYYKPNIQNFILEKMQKSMSATGYLITGEAETALVGKIDKMQMVAPPAAIFQIKE